jgi:hypothetical protein
MRGSNWILRRKRWQCGEHVVSRVRQGDPGLHGDHGTGSKGLSTSRQGSLSGFLGGRADAIPHTMS